MLSGPKRTMLQRETIARHLDRGVLDGKYGIEIEVEGRNLPESIPGWETHREGSLRGEAMEYVTIGAISDQNLPRYLGALTRQLTQYESRVNDTYRAGVHVHYNMLGRTFDSVIRSIILWSIVEPVFLKYCGKNRDGNLFCVSSYDTGDMPQWLTRFYEGVNRGSGLFQRIGRGKYSSLNSNCLGNLGTLECRAFPTTVDPEKITEFCKIVDCLLQNRDFHPSHWVTMADRQPEQMLNDIFGEELSQKFSGFCTPSLLGFGAETGFLLNEVYTEYMG
jgi:hypothetical protein